MRYSHIHMSNSKRVWRMRVTWQCLCPIKEYSKCLCGCTSRTVMKKLWAQVRMTLRVTCYMYTTVWFCAASLPASLCGNFKIVMINPVKFITVAGFTLHLRNETTYDHWAAHGCWKHFFWRLQNQFLSCWNIKYSI